MIGIYKITHTPTGEFYIGSSKNISQRFYFHKMHLVREHSLDCSWEISDYDVCNYKFEILEECDIDKLKERESYYILHSDPSLIRNVKAGDEQKSRRSVNAMTGKHWYNNGVESRVFYPEDVPNGWERGRITGVEGIVNSRKDTLRKGSSGYNNYLKNTKPKSNYIDTSDLDIQILSNNEFVPLLGILKNNKKATSQIGMVSIIYKYINGSQRVFTCTKDHPLKTNNGRKRADELIVGEDCLYDSITGSICELVRIVDANSFRETYDVETDNDMFDVSGIISHNCRTRVMSNIYDPSKEIVTGRGNLSFTSINLPRLAIESHSDQELFFKKLEEMVNLVFDQLLERFKIQQSKFVKNYPFLMGQGIWLDSDKLTKNDSVAEVLKHGTLTVGFIGLAECLKSLTGYHHGESEESQQLGLEIIGFMREMCDNKSNETGLNFSLIATPAEGLCLAGDTLVQTPFGNKPIRDIKAGDLIFSYNLDKRKVEIDTVVKSWMTSPKRKVLKITFDTGQEIICTPNHPFAVRKQYRDKKGLIYSVNGFSEYVEFVNAEDLVIGNRIKSNYIELSDTGYKRFKNSDSYIHKMVYEYYNGNIPDGYIVHHINEDKLDNTIENLQLMSSKDHKIYHMKDTIGKYCHTSESQSGENNSFYGKRHSDKSKLLISESKRLNKYESRLSDDYYNGMNIQELSSKYGVCEESVIRKLKSMNISMEYNHVVTNIEYLEDEIPVYDLTVTNNSNFFIGGDRGILVHNSGRFVKMDKEKYGIIEGVTDREYYTNSFHIPVYYDISAKRKIELEAPYHALTNGGHISYIEFDGDPLQNIEAFEDVIQYMKKCGIGYGSINHPVDRDPVCGYTGIIGDTCPRCGRRCNEGVSAEKLKSLGVSCSLD